ncbi:MAG: biosynthetic-type acetolactate synthase large subunit, partial [Solirubrobacterales bacterium]
MRAADALCEALKAEGVEHVFGIPGGASLPLYDALYDADFEHIQVRHEQCGGHAAEGYAKASGKVGVAFATSGPGATNLVTAIADAVMDSVPTVFITGQVRTDLIGTDGFQEADVTGITMPVVKHSFLVTDPKQIPEYVHQAFHIASSGRPGPVLIDIPQDLSRAEIDYELITGTPKLAGYQPTTEGNIKQIRIAAKAMANSRRPVIYAGGGVINANASEELRELARSDRFPVTCTLMGLGGFPAPDEQWLGMLGMHGTRAANYAMDEADLIVAIGARFDDRITGKLSEFAPRAKFIHIDVDPAEISKNVPAHIPIVGSVHDVLPKLTGEYRALQADQARLDEWWEQIADWRKAYPLAYEDSADSEIKPQFMVEELYRVTGGDAIITSDVGQHQMWAAQYYHFSKPRRWINSGGLGTMGFGLPAAIGAKVALPDQQVVCLAGDGSLIMVCQEMATAAAHDLDVKVMLLNNGHFGMVRQ